ncbi:MAG: ATP-dependent helicase, partial [Phycisphaerae bacterium]
YIQQRMARASIDPEEVLRDLTQPQREAVMHRDGPLLVLAGPGSGKTRVITRRAAYLAATVTEARHILAITFTNKAAEEMAQRIAALGVGPEMTICTFHSLCARLLRRFADRAGLPANFTIFDQTDRLAAVKDALKRCDFADENFPPSRIEERISRLKNAMISPGEAERDAHEFQARAVARIYRRYEEVLAEQNALDFDDLLLRVARLLGEDAELRDRLEEQYRYVLVDEYQDTNHAQYLIARGLALRRHNLCATGDPDQSIYGWRGANLGNILDFEKDFPETKVVRLEQNYRSTQHILAAADRVISRNRDRKKKTLWTHNAEGERVRIVECDDGAGEAKYIAEQIQEARAAGVSCHDMAIFYRINALTRLLEEALRGAAIPYRIVRGVEFYSRKEIKDVVAYLRVLVNPRDEVSLLRIINTPTRGIGATTVERLRDRAQTAHVPLMQLIRHPEEAGDLPRATAARVKQFAQLLDLLAPVVNGSAKAAIEQVLLQSGLYAALRAEAKTDTGPLENVNELINAAAEYDRQHPAGSLVEWLQQVSLVSDQDAYDPSAGAVSLMTLHAAKGLEFPAVFIAGCEEGLLPHYQHQDSRSELEEERRLFFVGMTRAKARLTLTYARNREFRGISQRREVSRFVTEIPRENADDVRLGADDRDERLHETARTDEYADWKAGQLVMHPSYGMGRLMRIDHRPGKTCARVRFNVYGEKMIVLEYSPLERVDPDEYHYE